MNIKIADSLLREYLDTKASAVEIAKYLSLCGPNVEKIQKTKQGYVYDIEVTTNRVDLMAVYGIARELSAILPRFGIAARLKPIRLASKPKTKNQVSFEVIINPKIINRAVGVVLGDIKTFETPEWMKNRLISSEIRILGAPVDITNYIMLELGQPMHVFDYDLIRTKKFKIRESKKGEKVVSLDGKEHVLSGGDVVIDDTTGKIIDLPGIIGTKNSVVNKKTKRVILFTENNDPVRMRRTSMYLGIRTLAATINEKGVDPTQTTLGILRGIKLFSDICKAKPLGDIVDIGYKKPEPKTVKVNYSYIKEFLGTEIEKNKIVSYLTPLGFKAKWTGETLDVLVPSFRQKDVSIKEDLIEEIARIHGYQNLPSRLMSGKLPKARSDDFLIFEKKLKNMLFCLGGSEIYTSSLIGFFDEHAYKLKNPMGIDSTYLRTSLFPGLLRASDENRTKKKFHIFELSNVYLPVKRNLPNEKPMLSGIFFGYEYRKSKGVIEALLKMLQIEAIYEQVDEMPFLPERCLLIKSEGKRIGKLGYVDKDTLYYEFDPELLKKIHKEYPKYKKPLKYPHQIEDITLTLPLRTKVGKVIDAIKKSSKFIDEVDLYKIYKDNFTFRVWYINPHKTMTNNEVEKIRNNYLKEVRKHFGARVKN